MFDPLRRPGIDRSARRLALRTMAALSLAPLSARAQLLTTDRVVAPFDSIVLRTVGDLVIEDGAQAPVRIEAEPAVLAKIVVRVADRTLFIESSGSFSTQRPLRYRVRVNALRRIEASGSGSIEAQYLRADRLAIVLAGSTSLRIATLSAGTLDLDIDGSGEARIGGKVATLGVTIRGSGTLDAANLASETARVAIAGSGDARVRVRDALDAQISGSGDLIYFGSPRVRQRITGSGSIEPG